ncbi:MAG TPA: hypothetical protein VND89_10000 [Acidimicrobiales bacterium]|nr:hypothetical protein [Acidimicrobiales bacterium]
MGLLKALFKLSLILTLGSVIAGAVYLVKRPKSTSPVSFEAWPSVPRNPAL